MKNDSLLVPNPDFSWQTVKGDLVVINLNSGDYHTFNSIGSLIWFAITEKKSKAEILNNILSKYNIEVEKAKIEMDKFIDKMLEQGLIQEPKP